MRVRELIEHLNTLPQNAEVVAVGHFGEPHHYTIQDFHFIDPEWSTREVAGAVEINQKFLGPNPD